MTTITVPRAFGGTLLIPTTPAVVVVPPSNVVLHVRNGKLVLKVRRQ